MKKLEGEIVLRVLPKVNLGTNLESVRRPVTIYQVRKRWSRQGEVINICMFGNLNESQFPNEGDQVEITFCDEKDFNAFLGEYRRAECILIKKRGN